VIATVKVSIPVPSSMLVVNILGVLGLAGLTVSVGALTGNWWWSVLVGSVILIGLSLVGSAHQASSAGVGERPAVAPVAARAAA
jgi:hypothetical protein